jgi:serine/threonine-protein kinase HipA
MSGSTAQALDPRSVERATVWKAGRPAATLLRLADSVEFCYREDYRGPPVATSLPISGNALRTASAGAVPPFFAGLLPEGRRLHALRRAVKTSADDDFSMLVAVGGDPIGDVQVIPEGEPAALPPPPPDTLPLAQTRFGELFARAVGANAGDRAGLPGVQDKVSGRMIAFPVSDAGDAYLLKLDPPEFPNLVANEALFVGIARACGIPTADCRVVQDAEARPGLLVRRFDRRRGPDGVMELLAQEDGCQVLGRYPADKYRVSAEELVAGLARRAGAPLVAARDLLRQLAFAYLTCNGDAHAKNFSIVDCAGEWRVSPDYDLPSSHPYGDSTMALPIAGRVREDIGREHFVELGAGAGLLGVAVVRVLDRLVAAVPRWIDRLSDLPFPARQRHKLRRAIEYRARRLGP